MRLRSYDRALVTIAMIGLSCLLSAACQRNFSRQETPPASSNYKTTRIEHDAQLYVNWVSMKTRIDQGAKDTQSIVPVARANPIYPARKDKVQYTAKLLPSLIWSC